MSSRLPQSKSYLKILGILYFVEDANLPIFSNIIKSVIKSTHIFNDIILASYPYIIKASPKSDIAVICMDIWNSQNSSNVKMLINRCFNIRSHIAMICGMNINLGISQCKNCWKWGYTTFVYCMHSTKCPKYNRLYKLEHHRDVAWCYKTNFKTNLSRLKTTKGKPCPHMFKYINCKGDYQICKAWTLVFYLISFFFLFFLFVFLFMDIGLGLEWHHNHTLSHISHIRWHGYIEHDKRFEK